jgi:hypothetical protein
MVTAVEVSVMPATDHIRDKEDVDQWCRTHRILVPSLHWVEPSQAG